MAIKPDPPLNHRAALDAGLPVWLHSGRQWRRSVILTVMLVRRRSVLLVATATAGICIALAWNHLPPPVSGVSIKVLSYNHFGEPIPNDSLAGTGIPVEVALINK